VPCQKCRYCLIGEYQMCPDHLLFGFHQKSPGAMASYMIYPAKARVHKVSCQAIQSNINSSWGSEGLPWYYTRGSFWLEIYLHGQQSFIKSWVPFSWLLRPTMWPQKVGKMRNWHLGKWSGAGWHYIEDWARGSKFFFQNCIT
jgi:hypothetical protein